MGIALATVLVAALLVSGVAAVGTGNGAISGKHYNLNLIGVKKADKLPNDFNSGARIFVNLVGKSKIYLTLGTTFDVIDADATDGRAEFMLPRPENEYDPDTGAYVGPGAYRVFIRELGQPSDRKAYLKTCAEYMENGEVVSYCSTGDDIVVLQRKKGQSLFDDVTRELTTVVIDGVRVDIFDDEFADYLWEYDNEGLKHVQLRFYLLDEIEAD
ncbi:MAG: hypothetical protein LUQ62_02655 [Methanomicrobiales archaeon]|nr:hypothetical protein [Methanomicrobiales archaeon]